MTRAVRLIEVPYMLGDERHGASRGPRAYLEAGAGAVAATVERVERDGPAAPDDPPAASLAVNRPVAAAVRAAADSGQLPLVLAGSCDVSLGVMAGFDHRGCGVVWIDAHGDFNTPESSVSGFFPGMSLAVLAGHCHRDLWARIGDSTPIREDATVLLGVRDLSPAAERERLERSAIRAVAWRDGRPQGDVAAALDALAGRVPDVYLHIDNDAFDPEVAPGIVDDPVPGGLTLEDMEDIVRAVTARFRLRAAALTTYNPDRDRDERTLRAGLRIIDLVVAGA